MKKILVVALLGLAVAAFLPQTASAGIWSNGIWENGNWSNGNWSNGIWENGVWGNGIWENGVGLQGGERPAGPLCTERGVDLSAVPLAKVTVRLPQPMG